MRSNLKGYLRILNDRIVQDPNFKKSDKVTANGIDIRDFFKEINGNGDNLLLLALKAGYLRCASWLMENGIDCTVINIYGENAFLIFVKRYGRNCGEYFLTEENKSILWKLIWQLVLAGTEDTYLEIKLEDISNIETSEDKDETDDKMEEDEPLLDVKALQSRLVNLKIKNGKDVFLENSIDNKFQLQTTFAKLMQEIVIPDGCKIIRLSVLSILALRAKKDYVYHIAILYDFLKIKTFVSKLNYEHVSKKISDQIYFLGCTEIMGTVPDLMGWKLCEKQFSDLFNTTAVGSLIDVAIGLKETCAQKTKELGELQSRLKKSKGAEKIDENSRIGERNRIFLLSMKSTRSQNRSKAEKRKIRDETDETTGENSEEKQFREEQTFNCT